MKRYNECQIDQSEVLDNCCHMNSALMAYILKVTLLLLAYNLMIIIII